MVEFALVAPVLFLMIFGIIEFSFINASIGAYNFAAKDAARLGSLLGRTDPNVDAEMFAVANAHVSGLVPAKMVRFEVFRSNENGAVNTSVEDSYDGDGKPNGTENWGPSLRSDNLVTADYLGVLITYQYTYITGFISGAGSTLQLTAISVQRIEPQDFEGRRGGTRPLTVMAVPTRAESAPVMPAAQAVSSGGGDGPPGRGPAAPSAAWLPRTPWMLWMGGTV